MESLYQHAPILVLVWIAVSIMPGWVIANGPNGGWTGRQNTLQTIFIALGFALLPVLFSGPAQRSGWHLAAYCLFIAVHWAGQFTGYRRIPFGWVGNSFLTCMLLWLGFPVSALAIAKIPNSHMRWRAIRKYGVDRFVAGVRAVKVDEDQLGNRLIYTAGDCWFAAVLDATTGEPHFIRVPPGHKTVDDAVAWTFGFDSGASYRAALVSEA